MRQQERQARSRQMILQAAMEEFGTQNYDSVNMERICGGPGISKGMMYHYYANKDALFLACVSEVFQALYQFLLENWRSLLDFPVFGAVKGYFLLREQFFQSRPWEKRIFENAMLYPPAHLTEQIQELRTPIREENDRFMREMLSRVKLRPGVDAEQAVRYLNSAYALFWLFLEQYQAHTKDLHAMLKGSEELLDMVLFGIAEQCAAEHQDV